MNTKKRKILSFFLSLLMAFSMVPFGELAGIDLTVQAEAAGVPGYNATAAVQWAKDHVYDVTSKLLGRGYWEAGTGDCANFVSQCIFMGGIDPVTDWMTNGYYAHFPVGSEGAWIRAPELYDFVTSIGGKSIKNPSASEVEPGDLIFYKKSGSSDMDHSAIVVEVSGNTVKIAAHTTLEKCYIADWRLDGFSPSGTYLVKMYGATCTEQVVRDVEVYTAPGNVDCKASPSSSAKKLFHTYKGEYYHVLEKKTVGGQTWGYTYGYGNDKIQWGWIPLSSMTYKGHYTTGPIDHLMGDWHQVVAPTCTTVGVEERECSRCGYTETRNMSIGGKHKNVVAATCLNPSYCTACGEILSDPLGHAMGDWIYITEPTCLTGGSRKCICERCGYTETEDVPALGHDFVANVTIPTCTTDGQSYYQCSRCDYSYIEDSEWSAYAAIDTSDPQYAEFLNNPELSRSRTEYRYRTKSTKTSTASSMSGWTLFDTVVTYGSWGSWSSWQDSKITETDTRDVGTRTVTTYKYWHNSITKKNGTVVTVPVSLAVYNEVANALGNSPGVSLKKHSITLTSKLTSTYVWGDIDGNEYTMYNGYKCCNTLDSSEDHWVFDGTGSKTQYRSRTRTKTTTYYYYKWSAWSNWDTTAQTASDTKEVEKRTTYSFKLAALGHDWDEGVTIAPTCYEQGYTRYTCQRCGITMDTDLVAPLGHDMHDDWYLISDDGTTKTYRRDCHRNCGYYEVQSESCVYTAEETVAPTCTSEGYTLYRCTLHPDETYQADIVPALGHQADENWVVTKAPTCTEAGEEVCHCVRFDDGVTCSQTYTREIAPVGHNLVKTEATERTCEQDGNIAYYTCQACNAVFADAEATTELTENEWILPATGHQGSTWVTEIAGACGVAQIERLYCENSWCDVTDNCGYENGHDSHHYLIEERTTPAEDHHFVLTGHRDPTCIELGEDTYTCDKCGETTSQYLTLTGHTWGEDIIYPQTCTEGGYTEKVCSYCGYTTYENATDATGHALSPNDEGYLESSDRMELISSVPNVCGSGSVDTYQCTHINNGERCNYTVVIGTPSEHTLGEYIVSKDPTCTEIGLQHKECQNEGCTYRTADEPIAPLNHAPGESYIIKGSCTEDGAQMLDCTRCGLNLENTAIDARGHQWGKWETIQETSCTEEGLQQRVCLNTTETEEYLACDAVETRPLSAIGHDWGEWETVTPATCEEEGLEQRICKNDPSHVEENTLPAIGHAWDEGVIDPSSTCNTHGTKTYTCKNDPAHTYTEEVPLNPDNHVGDTYVKDAKAPTCTEEGYTGDTYCADCDALLTKGEAIPATGHDWGEWETVTPATCEGAGLERRICKNDPSHVEENTLPAIGHDWDEGVIDPSSTCNTHGTKTYTCQNDPAHTYTEEVPLNPDNHVGDTYVKDAKAPTCTEEGYTGDTYCADCNALLTKGEVIPATGHDWGAWETVTPSTCEGEGLEQRICKNDPSHVEENTLPAIGHDWDEGVIDPSSTCNTHGTKTYTCKNDPSHTYTEEVPLNPDNHVGDTYVKDAKAPTCTEEGYTGDTYCADCNALLTKGEVIPATGHDWGEWETVTPATCEENGLEQRVCRNDSSHVQENILTATGHNWGDWLTVVLPTCEGEGLERRICRNDPSHVEENTLPATGHDYHLSEEKSLAPDYGVGGYDYYECANDPAHYYTVSIPALVKATYTVTFVAEGEVVAVVTYEEGDKFVKEPTAPEKDNYTVEWEEYELNDTNITVNAIYTPIDPDNVSEIETDKTVDAFEDGLATITLSAAAATRVIKLESVSTKPVDVILVLDLSGSMDESLGRRGDTKLEALQDCATSFIESLNANAVATGADHRVALVSFASADKRYNVSRWENTGLLVTGESGFVSYPNAAGYYDTAFMPTGDAFGVNRTLINAINNTKANGATCTHLGLLMAKNILAQTGADGREKVVVLITDGNPTIGGTVESEIAAAAPPAITYANDIKNMGVKLYTVGVEANADADQSFTSAPDGITGSGSRVSFDFNRFLHLVSSNYPDAEAMNNYGEKVNDGYYMPVNDTAALNDIFTKILVSSVYQKLVFTRCTLVDTLSADFVLTMEQENALRESLIATYNLTNEDISVQRNEDGTTTLRIENVPAVKTEVDGQTVYRAAVTFDCSLAASEKGSYETNTDKAWVEVGGEKVEDFEKPEAVTVESDRNIVVFTIGGEIYRIEEGQLGDTVVAPVTDLAQWSIPEGTVIEGSYAVFEAQSLSQQMHTVTWKIGEDTLVETYRFGEKITPPAVADQGELVFSGFSPAVPHIMPNYDMTFTALFAPRHEHFFKQTGFYGTCTEGLTIVSTCACGATREEKQAPSNHQFKAIIGTVDSNKLTDTLVCDFCGASEGHTLSFQTVTTAGRRTTIADLNLEKNGVLIQPAEGSSIKIMVPWSGRRSRVSVKRVNEQGVAQTYDASIENGYLVFYADHFSIYVLEELDENGNAYESVSYTSALCTLAGAHQYEQSETAPTCTTDGSNTYTCTVCGDTYSETIPMTGHTDQDGDKVCDTCGAILEGHPDLCVYCGQLHTGFFGWIVKFFHYILWIFQLIFA